MTKVQTTSEIKTANYESNRLWFFFVGLMIGWLVGEKFHLIDVLFIGMCAIFPMFIMKYMNYRDKQNGKGFIPGVEYLASGAMGFVIALIASCVVTQYYKCEIAGRVIYLSIAAMQLAIALGYVKYNAVLQEIENNE